LAGHSIPDISGQFASSTSIRIRLVGPTVCITGARWTLP
jgi:hypothetical protein